MTPRFRLRHWAGVLLFAKGPGGGEAYGVQLLVSSVSGRLSPRCLLDIQTEMLPEQSTMSFKFRGEVERCTFWSHQCINVLS